MIGNIINNQNKYGSIFTPCHSCVKKIIQPASEEIQEPREMFNEINMLAAVVNNPNSSTR